MEPNLIYGSVFGRIDCSAGGKSKSYKKMAEIRNNESYFMWLNYLAEKALSRYDIENVPDTCDEKIIKLSLLWNCSCGFIETETGLKSLPAFPGPGLTEYGYSKDGFAYARDGTVYNLKLYVPKIPDYIPEIGPGEYRAAIVYEDYYRVPFAERVLEMAAAVSDTWRKLEVARKNAATPYVVATDENSVPSVRRSLDKRDNNEEAVVLNFGFSVDKGNYFPIQDAMKGIDAFESHMEFLLNKFDTWCGISNNPVVRKKERVNSSEIEASADSAVANMDERMEALEEYFDHVNSVFGTDMKPIRREAADNAGEGLVPDAAGDDMGNA